jgi:hypothetical protein
MDVLKYFFPCLASRVRDDGCEEDKVSTLPATGGRQTCWLSKATISVAIILLVITMSTIAEADCWEDSLKQVDRDILVMGSEAVYQVVPEDEMTFVFWLPPAHIPICDSIVDVGGIPMLYYQLRNWTVL